MKWKLGMVKNMEITVRGLGLRVGLGVADV